MPAMRNFMIVASLLVGLGGCGSKDKFDEVLGEMGSFKDKMCACTDKACVDKVQDDWRTFRKGMKEKISKDLKPTDAQDKKARELDDEMRTCRRKFDAPEGGAGSAAPGSAAAGSAAAGSAAPAPATP
jgi:hypothetical protein